MSDLITLAGARTPLSSLSLNPSLSAHGTKRKAADAVEDEPSPKCRRPDFSYDPKEEKGEAAAKKRSYIEFPRADCILEADTDEIIDEFIALLDEEGISKILKYEIIDDTTIRFQHSRAELEALVFVYPKLYPYFVDDYDWSCFFQEKYNYRHGSIKGLCESPTAKNTLVRTIVEQANRHFQAHTAPSPVNFTFKADGTDRENLTAAYRRFQGVCTGEYHRDSCPKRFLIDNMETLRDLGVKTVFMENFLYDAHQPLLDHYFETPEAEVPILLKACLEDNPYEFESPYTLVDVLKAAKRCGIRIVGIDTSVANEVGTSDDGKPDPMERVKAMNYVAKRIIEKEKGDGKYLAYMGIAHAATIIQYDDDVPSRVAFQSTGMADLLQCPLLFFKDTEGDEEPSQHVNVITGSVANMPWSIGHVHLELIRSEEVETDEDDVTMETLE